MQTNVQHYSQSERKEDDKMAEKKLQEIYDTIISIIRNKLGNSKFDYEKAYQQYLKEKYEVLLTEFIAEEDEETVKMIVDSYIADEKNFWSKKDKQEVLVCLDKDPAFEYLSFLSGAAFEQAKKCVDEGTFLTNEAEYCEKFAEISSCLDQIKEHNIEAAKVVLSEAILDIEFAFGKSDVKSLRLARWR